MHNATLDLLSHKTFFLIASASGRRRSCLHALTVKPGFLDPQFLAKNQSATFTPQEIFLPALDTISSVQEDKRWCPVRALKWYVERTRAFRTSDRLFILPRRPHSPASKDIISSWIVDLIRPHLQQDERARAHDIRGHATSRAWFRGVPLEGIIRAAAWKTLLPS